MKTENRNRNNEIKTITLEQAKEFFALRKKSALLSAVGAVFCITSPVSLFIINNLIDMGKLPDYTIFVGLSITSIVIAIAIALFILGKQKKSEYAFLEKETFETEPEVRAYVLDLKKKYKPTYIISTIIGMILCILAVIPIIASSLLTSNRFVLIAMMATLLIVATGVAIFVYFGNKFLSMRQLLENSGTNSDGKKKTSKKERIMKTYWLCVTVIYFGFSFILNGWGYTWIIWPVTGILSAAISLVCDLLFDVDS